jgi:opacity protein-like surface antigen
MKLSQMFVVCAAVAAAPCLMAQKWELGAGVGGGFYTSQDVTSAGATASAKLQNNIAGSVWLGNNRAGHWGGDFRYDYQRGDLQLSSAGTQALFAAQTHALHYDILWQATSGESKVRPFVAFGGGVKIYEGTGTEAVYQPLSNFALLTKDQDLTGLVSVGAGIKFQIAPHVQLRVDVHDYLTPFPKKVITPNVNSKVGGWLQDFVPMVGLSFTR